MTNIGSPNDQYRSVPPSSVGMDCLLGRCSFRHAGESDEIDPLDGDIVWKGGTIFLSIRLCLWRWRIMSNCLGMEWVFGEILVSLCTTS